MELVMNCNTIQKTQLLYNTRVLHLENTLQQRSLQNRNLLLSSSAQYWTFTTHECPGYKLASCITMAVKFTGLKATLVKYLWIHVVVTAKKLHHQLNSLPDCFLSLSSPHWIVFHEIQSMSLASLQKYLCERCYTAKEIWAASKIFWCSYIHCFIRPERFQFGVLWWRIKFGFHMSVIFQIRKWTVKNDLDFFPLFNLNYPLSHKARCFCRCLLSCLTGHCGRRGWKWGWRD